MTTKPVTDAEVDQAINAWYENISPGRSDRRSMRRALEEFAHSRAVEAVGAVPKLPSHPEPHSMTWSRLELEAISDYGNRCFEAGRTAPPSSKAQDDLAGAGVEGVQDGWFLPRSALNEPMIEQFEKLLAHAKRARWTNAVVRKDAVETPYEADWIKRMIPVASQPKAPAPVVVAQGEAVAWRHNRTHSLFDSESEVPLGDGDEWAEPLYLLPPTASRIWQEGFNSGSNWRQEVSNYYEAGNFGRQPEPPKNPYVLDMFADERVTPPGGAGGDVGARPCTCHPDDNPPVPCAKKYALTECRSAEQTNPVNLGSGASEVVQKDAERYRYMRNNAAFMDRNGPGLYWYLPRYGRHGTSAEQLDHAIDAALSSTVGRGE